MIRYLALLFISPSLWAGLDHIQDDKVSMIEHVGLILSKINENKVQRVCGERELASESCSPVLKDYMDDREYQGIFKFFVSENPKEQCSAVELNDSYYTSSSKLDQFFQDYTYGMVPRFGDVNQGCFGDLTSLKDQNSAVSYYYYAQMRLLQDGIMNLTSQAAIDKKLGRPVLAEYSCDELGKLKSLCHELKGCGNSVKDLSNDVAEIKMALNLKKKLEESEVSSDQEDEKKDEAIAGIKSLYPMIEGKEFEKVFEQDKLDDDSHIELAITKQLQGTKVKLQNRVTEFNELSSCIENRSKNCDDFHKRLNKLTQAPIVGGNTSERDILARSYQNQQACINNQIGYRDNANEAANGALISSGLTIATMGLGAVAMGSGHIIKGVHTAGMLSRAQKIHRTAAKLSLHNSNKIKLGAKYLALSLNGAFTAKGLDEVVEGCKEDLNHLVEFKKLTANPEAPGLCPKDNRDPEFQLMSDIKSCVINAALTSLDFLPVVPYGIAKYRSSKPNKINENLLEESQWMMDPKNLQLKKMDKFYLREEKGMSEGLAGFANPRQSGVVT
ncbi:MAG: hypothetical protein KC478_05770, partial [Bacteriovoracaceae bacterium]|nr:hypothetical protein [Bacteriovoracaceae bacterium]